jgi:hypothetical protein
MKKRKLTEYKKLELSILAMDILYELVAIIKFNQPVSQSIILSFEKVRLFHFSSKYQLYYLYSLFLEPRTAGYQVILNLIRDYKSENPNIHPNQLSVDDILNIIYTIIERSYLEPTTIVLNAIKNLYN